MGADRAAALGQADPRDSGSLDPFRSLAETTPDAIITANAADEIVYVNPAAERLLGYAPSELIGQPVKIIVPENQRAAHESAFHRFVATGIAHLVGQTVVVDALRRDGSLLPVELSLGAAGEGAQVTVTAVIRDITQRVRFQRNVAAQLAVTSVLAGADGSDGSEGEASVIRALTESLGWQVGALWRIGDDDALALTELWEADPAATGVFGEACRASRFRRGEGIPGLVWETAEPHWLEQSSQEPRFIRTEAAALAGLNSGVSLPLISEGGVLGVMEIFTSSTLGLDEDLRDMLLTVASQVAESMRRQQHADELARSNQDLEHFAHMVAHDLSEPLHTIAGFSELLRTRQAENLSESGREWVDAVLSAATRGRQMLKSVLALAQFGSGPLRVERVDANELIAEVLVALRANVSEQGATVDVGDLPVVVADRALLGQVFQNLLANAIKFRGDDAPRIRVGAEVEETQWRFWVADNGVGVPGGVDVFEMFVRPSEQAQPGMGLGLAICAKIVKRHGGTIWFDSAPGAGTTFHFSIARPADT